MWTITHQNCSVLFIIKLIYVRRILPFDFLKCGLSKESENSHLFVCSLQHDLIIMKSHDLTGITESKRKQTVSQLYCQYEPQN